MLANQRKHPHNASNRFYLCCMVIGVGKKKVRLLPHPIFCPIAQDQADIDPELLHEGLGHTQTEQMYAGVVGAVHRGGAIQLLTDNGGL